MLGPVRRSSPALGSERGGDVLVMFVVRAVIGLILGAAPGLAQAEPSDPPEAVQITSVTPQPQQDGGVFIEVGLRNNGVLAATNLCVVLQGLSRRGDVLADSLQDAGVAGPWTGNLSNPPGSISYAEARLIGGASARAYALGPRADARCVFHVSPASTFASTAVAAYRVEIRRLGEPGLLAARQASSGLMRVPRHLRPLVRGFTAFALVPWLLLLLTLPLFRRREPGGGEAGGRRRLWRLWRAADIALTATVVVAATWVFYTRMLANKPVERENDSFDYMSIAERFGPPLDHALIGAEDRGYDRREFLHHALDRSWGYPLLVGTVARVSGDPARDSAPLLRNLRAVNVAFLLASCVCMAWLVYRHWTPGLLPLARSGLVYAAMLLQGYNVYAVNRVLTEVPSRFFFMACLLAALSFWSARTPRRACAWIVTGTLAAFAAMLLRSEHALVEPVMMPGLIVLTCRRPGFVRRALTWVATVAVAATVIVVVSYATYGTWRFVTGGGYPLLKVIYRLPADGSVHIGDVPPRVRFTDAERTFYEEYMIPAGRHPGGRSNAYITLPGFLPSMTPMEYSAFMSRYTRAIVWRNRDLWLKSSLKRFLSLNTEESFVLEGPVTGRLGPALNACGPRGVWWNWPAGVGLWLLGRWAWGRRAGCGMRLSPLLIALVVWAYYWYVVVTVAAGGYELRYLYFSRSPVLILGALIVLDGVESAIRQAWNMARGIREWRPGRAAA